MSQNEIAVGQETRIRYRLNYRPTPTARKAAVGKHTMTLIYLKLSNCLANKYGYGLLNGLEYAESDVRAGCRNCSEVYEMAKDSVSSVAA